MKEVVSSDNLEGSGNHTDEIHRRLEHARKMLGIGDEEENANITILDILPEWAGQLFLSKGLPIAATECVWSGESAILSRDGKEIPVHQVILANQLSNGEVEYFSTIMNIKKTEEKELLVEKVFENISEGILVTDANGTIVFVNPAFTKITGYSKEEAIGQNPSILSSGRNKPDFYEDVWTSCLETGRWKGEISGRRKNGENYLINLSIHSVKNEQGKTIYLVGIFQDITLHKQLEEQIRHLTQYDALTDLPNWTLFLDRLTQLKAHAQENEQMLAVMFLDLDRFKFINDTLGHSTGDLLLQKVANRLENCVQEKDTICRLGGDEFIILLSGIFDIQDVVKLAKKILEALSQPFVLNDQEYTISASIGISLYPIDGSDKDTLIKNADIAMFYAKEYGNHYQFFHSSMNVLISERLKLENDLRKALDRKEFFLQYQPKFNLNTGEITGVEALVRWRHPEYGIISPMRFVPLAEEIGLILPLGEWVLHTACKQNKAWQDAGLSQIRVAVNFSQAQFQQKNLAELIAQILNETGLSPRFLELEVTESLFMKQSETIIHLLQELRKMGIQISLDDFGTGYSSLSYLKQLPLDMIKIDRSFIENIKISPNDMYIVKAMIDLAHSLNMGVITEGVETEEQIDVLRSYKCDEVQGYFLSPPVSSEEFKELLQKKRFKINLNFES